MHERVAADADGDVRLVRLLRLEPHALRRPFTTAGSGPRRRRVELRRELLDPLEQRVVDLAADADDEAARPVPAVEVIQERLARGAAHRLLAADDVPAERLVAVDELLAEPLR